MPRGGKRVGAGGKFKWKSGKTTVIRVPISLVDEVIAITRMLDEKSSIEPVTRTKEICYDDVTSSKVIDLSGITIRSFLNQPAVLIADLIVKGYKILPERLNQSPSLKQAIQKRLKAKEIADDINKM